MNAQAMPFEEWLAEACRLDNALDSGHLPMTPENCYLPHWRAEYDKGKTPRAAVLDNYDGGVSGATLDAALAKVKK